MVKAELDATELRAIAKELGTSVGKLVWLLYVPTPVPIIHVSPFTFKMN